MNFLRQIVSGPKNRYKQDGFNLDLTYISSRVIAMAFPAEGIQKLYRNSIDTVAEFLENNHKGHYIVINISNREIEDKKLREVHSFSWEDHKSPTIHLLFEISSIVANYLNAHEENVVAVHCNHGKGRTGTLTCCLLIYMKAFNYPQQAMKYYAEKRFEQKDMGVTQPCQIKYIQYFAKILANPAINPITFRVTKIKIKGSHKLNNPYIKIKLLSIDQYVLNTHHKQQGIICIAKQEQITIRLNDRICIAGDVLVEIKNESKLSKNLSASYTFNTGFVDSQVIVVPLQELSPLSAVKSGDFGKDFSMEITVKRFCQCPPNVSLAEKCQECQIVLKPKYEKWAITKKYIDQRNHILSQREDKPLYGILDENIIKVRRSKTIQ